MSSSSVAAPTTFASGMLCGHEPLFFRVHGKVLTVEDITAIGTEARRYMRSRWSFQHSWDDDERGKLLRSKTCLLARLNRLGSWTCTREELLDDILTTFDTSPSRLTWAKPLTVESEDLEPSESSSQKRQSQWFSKLSPPSQQILSPTPASPSPSISNLFSDEVWSSPISIPPITVHGYGTLNDGAKIYGQGSPSPILLTSAITQPSSIEQAGVVSMSSASANTPDASGPSSEPLMTAVTSTEAFHTLLVSPMPSMSPNKDVSGETGIYGGGVETEVTASRRPELLAAPNNMGSVFDDRSVPSAGPLQDVLDELAEAPMSVEVLSMFQKVIKETDEKDDAVRLGNLMELARRMDASKHSATRKQAGDEVWFQLMFTNIWKTKTRTLKGCKVANRVNIASWDLIPVKGVKACTCCATLYPCEYTSWNDIMKCHECKMNGKSCSWADSAKVVHDSDSEDSVIEMLTAVDMKKRSFEKIDNPITSLPSKRSKTHVVTDDARLWKPWKADLPLDRVTRSKSTANKGPDQSNKTSRSSLSSKQPDMLLVDADENNTQKTTVDRGLQLCPSAKIPTVTLRWFLPPVHGERASAPVPKLSTSNTPELYTLPPVSVEEILDHAGKVKAQLRNMSLEEIIQEAAHIIVDRAELNNTIESLELKWDRNKQMQDEIFEMVSERFMSFQSDFIEEVICIKQKWQSQ
ncbi:hypothetical protein EV421DRAFT_1912146 [Armillaria borealis]|uniref:Uncharacterized protein n=1 Tax=Armillaria borealis TaxID=47425 RepID=A0AA39IXT4_9AGAR|nr:hypothetical protein EV421DRAFT_1912146 [Armillaria borealis]